MWLSVFSPGLRELKGKQSVVNQANITPPWFA